MQSQVQYTKQPRQGPQQVNIPESIHPLGDMIQQLPSDMSVPSHNEIKIVDRLFQRKKSMFDKIMGESTDIIVLSGLFVVFSLPFIDNLIIKFIPASGTSPYILIGVKALIFVLIYFIIKNIYLVRKNSK
jgi:hypothetical protein